MIHMNQLLMHIRKDMLERVLNRVELVYFQLRLRSLPIVRRGGSVRIAAESGTPLFLPVPVGVNARIAVGTYS